MVATIVALAATASCGASDTEEPARSVRQEKVERVTYDAETATRYFELLEQAGPSLDLSRMPTDLAGFISDGGKVFSGTIGEAPTLSDEPITNDPTFGHMEDLPSPLPVATFLSMTLVTDTGELPVLLNLGVRPRSAQEVLASAPPPGARMLIMQSNDPQMLAPTAGLFTVIETGDGGLVLGGPRVEDRTALYGFEKFSDLEQHLAKLEAN